MEGVEEESFVVGLERSERSFVVKPGASILGTLRDAGVDLAYSCEEGICGACEVKFSTGPPEHRDFFRSAEDHDRNSTVIICQARCRTAKLVLEI